MGQTMGHHAYQLGFQIGSGGMAVVRYGRRVAVGGFVHSVAIKELHPHLAVKPELASMFLDEARLAARVVHPNVVSVLDVVSEGERVWAIMQYIEGESLGTLFALTQQASGGVPLRVALAVMLDVLAGLEAAHRATDEHGQALGIVHRDVSPQNVLVGVDGVARVLDFGVAKARGRMQETRDGQVKGKLAYMAPEHLGGEASIGTDVYAAAIVLWELLANRRLFDGASELELIGLVLGGATTPPSAFADVPAHVDAIVMKALSLDPSARFSSAAAMAQALLDACPSEIASRAEVAEWLSTVASEKLAERRRLVAEMARSPASVAPPSLPSPPSAPEPSAKLPPPAPSASVPPPPGAVPSSTQVMRPVIAAPARRRSRRAAVTAAVGLVLLLLAGGAAAVRLGRSRPMAVASEPAAPPSVVAPASEPPVTAAAPSATAPERDHVAAQASAAKTRNAPPSPARGAPRSSASKARIPSRSDNTAEPSTASTQAPVESCDPPFNVDANGVRTYKRACIK